MERLAALLRALDPDGGNAPPNAREVAELLWLAGALPGPAAGDDADATAGRPRPEASDRTTSADGAAGPPTEVDAPPTRLFLPGPEHDDGAAAEEERAEVTGTAATERAAPVRVSGPAALPRARELGRALRPLKRRVPSAVRTVLDEDATAGRIAEHGHWLPVLVPEADRWLDVSLVLDAFDGGAAFWEPLGRELRTLLQRLGAFRDVRLHHLLPRADGTAGLAAGPAVHDHQVRAPGLSVDPAGRTLTLVLTDGVSPAWRTRTLLGPLHTWATGGPTAILQALPERVWDSTALAPEPGRFRSTEAGGPNTRLLYEGYRLDATPTAPGAVAVPVLGITPEWLAPWARAVAGPGAFDSAAVVVPAAPPGCTPRVPEPRAGFEEFRARAHPEVFRLATYLAAAPLNLAVMRTVQAAMVPDSPPSDLAEIVYSGLLERVGAATRADGPLDRAYDFAPGVRERLLSTLRRDEADDVITAVSTYYERHSPGFTARFTAAVTDPDGPLTLPVGARHWAEVHSLVRRKQGRGVARVATRRDGLPEAEREEERPRVAREGRRFLITIAVSDYADGPVRGVREDVLRVGEAFGHLSYEHPLSLLNPSASVIERAVTEWAEAVGLHADDAVAVYYAGHAGFPNGRAALVATDHGSDTQAGLLPLEDAFAGLLRSEVGHVLFLFDTSLHHAANEDHPLRYVFDAARATTNIWALTMPISRESADGSDFTKAVSHALRTPEADPAVPFVSVERFHQRLGQILRGNQTPQEVRLSTRTSDATPAPFFPNPSYASRQFAPNVAALTAVSTWLRTGVGSTCLVVGSDGFGRLSLLSDVIELGAPGNPLRQGLPQETLPPAAARYLTLREAEVGGVPSTGEQVVVVADDVGTHHADTIDALAALRNVKVIAAPGPGEELILDGEALVIDLDSPEYRLPMEQYVHSLLSPGAVPRNEARVLADQIALLSGQSRTMARLLVDRVRQLTDRERHTGGVTVPEIAGALDAFVQRFDETARDTVRRLLKSLAYAKGQGVSVTEWQAMTTAVFGGRCRSRDIEWFASHTDELIVMSAGPDGVWFRLPHPALADALRIDDDQTAHQAAITQTLTSLVPPRPGLSGPDWPRAGRYTRRHLASHAADGDVLGTLLDDTGFLVAADPTPDLLDALASLEDGRRRRDVAVYQQSYERLRTELSPAARRDILAFGALSHGDVDLARALAKDCIWTPHWCTEDEAVTAVESAVARAKPLVASGHEGGFVEVRDLSTGQRLSRTRTSGGVATLTCVHPDGTPHVVALDAAGFATLLRLDDGSVWAQHRHRASSGPPVAATGFDLDDGAYVVATPVNGLHAELWNAVTGAIRRTLTLSSGIVDMARTHVSGRPHVVAAARERLHVNALDQDDNRFALPFAAPVTTVSCTYVDAVPVAVAGTADGRAQTWDLQRRARLHTLWLGSPVGTVVAGLVGGVPHAVATGADDPVAYVWNLTQAEPDVHRIHLPAPASALALTYRYLSLVIDGSLYALKIDL
ncbi:SAV_2336 N-terminal domain-related protein [Streptomyces sp. NPDC048629]|uniref:SAV_2336 N-terminal domain-related protein n=1 Tax=Streptomyces sp. NPDC048629 TaxID=3154824 RepID=UPI00343F73F5